MNDRNSLRRWVVYSVTPEIGNPQVCCFCCFLLFPCRDCKRCPLSSSSRFLSSTHTLFSLPRHSPRPLTIFPREETCRGTLT